MVLAALVVSNFYRASIHGRTPHSPYGPSTASPARVAWAMAASRSAIRSKAGSSAFRIAARNGCQLIVNRRSVALLRAATAALALAGGGALKPIEADLSAGIRSFPVFHRLCASATARYRRNRQLSS